MEFPSFPCKSSYSICVQQQKNTHSSSLHFQLFLISTTIHLLTRSCESAMDALHKGRVTQQAQQHTQLHVCRICSIHQVLPLLITIQLLRNKDKEIRSWPLRGQESTFYYYVENRCIYSPQSPNLQYRCYVYLVALLCNFLVSPQGTLVHNPVWFDSPC